MKILAIETSCDETAVSIVEAKGEEGDVSFKVLGNALFSQASLHKEFGGVYPNLAKREHQKNLVPLLKKALEEAGPKIFNSQFSISNQIPNPKHEISNATYQTLNTILEREPELKEQFVRIVHTPVPDIDAIAVTYGPGLEPALWVGINFAKALALLWSKPLIPINHMEGHITSSLMSKISKSKYQIEKIGFPVLALLISGGHTELVLMRNWQTYEVMGETLDDAVGEAFDKVARMLGLPYPGGPEISKLAEEARQRDERLEEPLPRPMLHSKDFNFSFAGLKTAVLYRLREMGKLDEEDKRKVSREFEDAVTEVLLMKTRKAAKESGAKTLAIGGGVAANKEIQRAFRALEEVQNGLVALLLPSPQLTGDNAVMIAAAAYFRLMAGEKAAFPAPASITAAGNLRL